MMARRVMSGLLLCLLLSSTAAARGFNVRVGSVGASTLQSPPCPTRSFTVVNEVGVPTRFLSRVERAVTDQSRQVRRYWHSPCAAFTASDGWPLEITWNLTALCEGINAGGCHGLRGGEPAIDVAIARADYLRSWTVAVSHEVLETLVDPTTDRTDPGGSLLEICDPVDSYSYRLGDVWVSDWTLPAYWRHNWKRAWDLMRRL